MAKTAKAKEVPSPPDVRDFATELVAIADLRPHPKNYKAHPEDQLAHIEALLRAHGPTKNVIVARDGTILAGHGVILAAGRVGYESFPVRRLPLDPDESRALALLAGDNEISNLAAPDDRALTELLKAIMDSDEGLLGTGFDEQQLAALAFVTRPQSELATIDEAAAWAGMPEFASSEPNFKVVVNFTTQKDRDAFIKKIGARIFGRKDGNTWSCWWPPRSEKQDLASVKFVPGGKKKAAKKAS